MSNYNALWYAPHIWADGLMSSWLAPLLWPSVFIVGFVQAFCFGANKWIRNTGLATFSTENVVIEERAVEVAVQWVPKDWPTLVSLTHLFSGIPPLPCGKCVPWKAFRMSVLQKILSMENNRERERERERDTHTHTHTHTHTLTHTQIKRPTNVFTSHFLVTPTAVTQHPPSHLLSSSQRSRCDDQVANAFNWY